MLTVKEEIMKLISDLPDTATIDDIMYKLYVIDKIKKGKLDIKEGRVISTEELKEEIAKW